MFLQTIAPEDATGEIAEIYNAEIAKRGFLMQATVAMLAYAEQVAKDASSVTSPSLTSKHYANMASAKSKSATSRFALRCGASSAGSMTQQAPLPKQAFLDEDPEFRSAMTVGKPLS